MYERVYVRHGFGNVPNWYPILRMHVSHCTLGGLKHTEVQAGGVMALALFKI